MKTGYLRYGTISLYIICLFSLLISCGGGLEEETGGSITLTNNDDTPDAPSIPADGFSSLEITAEVHLSSGDLAYDGTTVTFTTDLGSFSRSFSRSASVSVLTSGGKAVVSLIAGTTPGIATVVAEANNISQSITVSIIDTTPGETASITLTPLPICIPPDGFSSSTITAELKDSSGDPVSPGTPITFTTNLGSFSGGTTYSTWTSDTDGIVTVSLIAGTTPGTATVRATSNNVTQAVSVLFRDICPTTTTTTTAPTTTTVP